MVCTADMACKSGLEVKVAELVSVPQGPLPSNGSTAGRNAENDSLGEMHGFNTATQICWVFPPIHACSDKAWKRPKRLCIAPLHDNGDALALSETAAQQSSGTMRSLHA